MQAPLYWIDAFSAVPFGGNPAAVVPLESWLPDVTMQRIAFENGLAETAFLVARSPAGAAPRYQLRWFTPAVEVDLCGHATLASGHVVLRELAPAAEAVTFETRSGPLIVTRRGGRLAMDFPATPVAVEADPAVATAVAEALGQRPVWSGRSRFDRFAVLPDAASVRALRPDLARVVAAGGRGLIVTAPGDGSCDFVSRFFGPQVGVPEDPVTGSAHCALVPFWAERLGRRQVHARQVSARGGELWCEFLPGPGTAERDGPNAGGKRVRIEGDATLYLRGELVLPPPHAGG